jgi:hypothetical protein
MEVLLELEQATMEGEDDEFVVVEVNDTFSPAGLQYLGGDLYTS